MSIPPLARHDRPLARGTASRPPARRGAVLFDRRRFYDARTPLGAIYTPEATVFRLFAPSARQVALVLADQPTGRRTVRELPMGYLRRGIWERTVPGNLAGQYYAYKLGGVGLDAGREVVDPYAVCAQNRYTRALIVDLGRTDPLGFRSEPFRRRGRATDAIVYEMHIRDFSIAADSGIRHKGRYLGLTETGCHLSHHPTIRTGLDHLVELGVTHVQLMPVQDFDNDESDETRYRWGYMPVHFNTPDGWYAGKWQGPSRITELKRAIQAFHRAGIGVVLDVVYNHTAPPAGFENIVPRYYYRRDRRGRYANGSGCGNEFRSESPMARRFIIDSLKYWVTEYRVDGFRFDMMALIDLDTLKAIRAELTALDPDLLLYGEPWSAGKTPLRRLSDKRHLRGTGIGAFNDEFRDAIKGERDGGGPGFIQTGERIDALKRGLAGIGKTWPGQPAESVNYFECHDNLTAWDKLLQSVPEGSDALRSRMLKLASLILLTAQGQVFLHAGQEFGRPKGGHTNSYNLPDEINRLDWSLKRTKPDLWAYVRGLIAFRRAHAALRLADRDEVDKRVSFPDPPGDRCLIYAVTGRRLTGETAREIRVLLNGQEETMTFPLPPGSWQVHADADQASDTPIATVTVQVDLPGHSGMLVCR